MNIRQKRDFLTTCAYWGVIVAAVYLILEYLVPISVPFILGVLIAYLVVWVTRKLHCPYKTLRLIIALVIYGILGLLVTLIVAKGVSIISGIISWLPALSENKLVPFVTLSYEWVMEKVRLLDPAMFGALEMLLDSILAAVKNLISYLSGSAVNLVSSLATGVPSLVLSLLAMIFSTVFVVSDYDRIRGFASLNLPAWLKTILKSIKVYLTDTLFVVIRSYALIMLITFTELSILFTVFGIENAILKAALIAMVDILPILGTGGVMIPWAIISLVLGHAGLGIQLFVIYAIVTVVRNYVEPKIVGAQLGLHPIITLFSMFIGLRLFGFWGLFGLPVGISFLWKQRQEKKAQEAAEETATEEPKAIE